LGAGVIPPPTADLRSRVYEGMAYLNREQLERFSKWCADRVAEFLTHAKPSARMWAQTAAEFATRAREASTLRNARIAAAEAASSAASAIFETHEERPSAQRAADAEREIQVAALRTMQEEPT
jgi:hypothetical protein